jgi:type IV secretory pathway VirB10-like protein
LKLYNCRVRINGSLLNVIPRYAVTAAEIVLLRSLHSRSENANEPVIDVVEVGAVNRPDAVERQRLADTYSFGELNGPRLVHQVFGPEGVPLPQEVADAAPLEPTEEQRTGPGAEEQPKRRGRRSNADLAAMAEKKRQELQAEKQAAGEEEDAFAA